MTTVPYTLFKRSKVYYYRVNRPDGSRSSARSTGKTNRRDAEASVREYLQKNTASVVAGKITFRAWAEDFWKPDSRYVRLRRAHGYRLSASHVDNQNRIVKKHLLPEFGDIPISEITTDHVESFLLQKYESGEYAGRTINAHRTCLKTVLEEAVRLGRIDRNPVTPVHKFKEDQRERGTFTRSELWELLFKPDALRATWSGDRRFFLLTTVAAVTGMRQGELRALMPKHVHVSWISVVHAWDDISGLTDAPKWGKVRVVTVPEKIVDALRRWVTDQKIPEDGYMFPSTSPHKKHECVPVSGHEIAKRFHVAMATCGISDCDRKRRNLTFHGLRHSLVTLLRASRVDEWQGMQAVGHSNVSTFDGYAHAKPEHLSDVARLQLEMLEPPDEKPPVVKRV